MSETKIPEAAIEAAVKALAQKWFGPDWQRHMTERNRAYWAEMAAVAIEAATPYTAEQNWDDGYQQALYDEGTDRPHRNPYRADQIGAPS